MRLWQAPSPGPRLGTDGRRGGGGAGGMGGMGGAFVEGDVVGGGGEAS